MKRNIFIIHGIYGNPKENWFPWIKNELEHLGCNVTIPSFPTKEDLTLDDWISVWRGHEYLVQDDSILIGHSLGVAFALTVLEKQSVHASFFIAPAWGITGNEFDSIMGHIANQQFDWAAIRKHCGHCSIFHSDNDPYLPLERAETLARYLGVDVHLIPGAGHFNAASRYNQFEELLVEVKQVL